MLPWIIAHIAVDIFNLVIGIYVVWKNPSSTVGRFFFLFILGVVGWSAGMMLILWTGQLLFVTLALWGGELVLLGFVIFAEIFPNGCVIGRRFFFLILPWCVLFFLTPTGLFIRFARFNAAGHYLEPKNGPLFPFFGLVISFYIVLVAVKFYRKYHLLHSIRRVQMRYLATGAGLFIFAAFITEILLPSLHIFQFNLCGPLFSVVFIGCTAYAIVHHKFMDISIVVQRGLMYASSIAVISVAFFGIDFLVRQFTQQDGWSDDVIAAIVGAFGFIWFRRFFERATDSIFFRKDYDYAVAVRELGPLLNETIDLEILLRSLDDFLMRTIKPERIVFVFRDISGTSWFRGFFHVGSESFGEQECLKNIPDIFAGTNQPLFIQELEKEETGYSAIMASAKALGIAAIIPLPSRDGNNAAMLLGGKLSDDIFRSKDIELLSVLAHQAGMAIENARFYTAVRRHGEELERRVVERTEEMRGMQEAQSKFLTDVSHELQTPIAIVKGNMEILERKRKGERKTAIRVMATTINRMSQMIDSLLAVARLNFSKEKLHKTHIAVEDILEEAYNDCLILAENKGIILSYSTEQVLISGDKDKLKEVVLNLVSNALKHTSSGGTISLIGRAVGVNAEIAIEDSGSGITPENLSHIFERFYRIKAEGCPGTGLGLDICRKIIEAHGGTITAESERGKGSRFIVSLLAVAEIEMAMDVIK